MEVSMREVGLAPCFLPAIPDDPYIISSTPGLYPDPLFPLTDGCINLSRRNWHAIWISIKIADNCKAGVHGLTFGLNGIELWGKADDETVSISLKVIPARLPKQKLIQTNWFHADCIWTYYKVPCWSEEHWRILEKYFANMASHGINMLLTPLWTLPLDTAVGSERPTTQLLEIELKNGKYRFDFSRLERWIDTALNCGIEYFEMSHAFTQWGAAFTPKIMVRENGVEKRMFGWDVPADSPEYRDFLNALVPELTGLFDKKELQGKCFFHVSDEPAQAQIESYGKASKMLRNLVAGYPVMDALSDIEFYKSGMVGIPVPSTEHIAEFMKEILPQRWIYYCGNWRNNVPNRQFGMPSERNRIMGLILYLYDLDGFLNWGYNFWYSVLSYDQELDPYKVTDAKRCFCGGGSFNVYPGKNGEPVDSLHYEVFREGIQDLRALRLLESLSSREKTLALIHEGLDYRITINRYPHDAAWLLELRQRVNNAISSLT